MISLIRHKLGELIPLIRQNSGNQLPKQDAAETDDADDADKGSNMSASSASSASRFVRPATNRPYYAPAGAFPGSRTPRNATTDSRNITP
jgi:hypothetical protein